MDSYLGRVPTLGPGDHYLASDDTGLAHEFTNGDGIAQDLTEGPLSLLLSPPMKLSHLTLEIASELRFCLKKCSPFWRTIRILSVRNFISPNHGLFFLMQHLSNHELCPPKL